MALYQLRIDACNYCSEVIKLNLLMLSEPHSESIITRKKELIDNIRPRLEGVRSFHGNINSDKDVNDYLFGIYTKKLDSDKYGVNNWGRKNGRYKSKHSRAITQ